jgi:hypothetical protein
MALQSQHMRLCRLRSTLVMTRWRPTSKSDRPCNCGVSRSSAKNISLVPSGKSEALSRASRAEGGALANVINAERDAMDADAPSDERC